MTIEIPTPLRVYTANQSAVAVDANTVTEAVSALLARYPEVPGKGDASAGEQLPAQGRARPGGFPHQQRAASNLGEARLRMYFHDPVPCPAHPPVDLENLDFQGECLT